MKYEMIFGDEALFDGAPDDAEYAGWFCQEIRWYMILNGKILFSDGGTWCTSDNPYLSADIVAMRRIIKEPKRWTVEDQKAGRLPEVGSKYLGKNELNPEAELICDLIDGDECVWGHDKNKKMFCFYASNIKPIETPAEKAQREEDEWVNKAWSETAVFAGVTQDEHDRLRIHLRHIYRAQLSGELAAPKGGE